jgi:hypothetical protein
MVPAPAVVILLKVIFSPLAVRALESELELASSML